MDSKNFILKAKRFETDLSKLRYQLIIIVGSSLTVFAAIHGGDNVSSSLRWGFIFMGCSLVSGVLSLFSEIFQNGLEVGIDYKDKVIPFIDENIKSLKDLGYNKKENIEFFQLEQEFEKVKNEYGKMDKSTIKANGLNVLRKIIKRGYLNSFTGFAVGSQFALFIAGVIYVTFSIVK